MFEIGTKVKWQIRNSNRSNRKAQASFLRLEGVVTQVSDKSIICQYTTTVGNTDLTVNTHHQEFRQLRNGNWIAKQEPKDDPKGRLTLKVA